MAKFDVLNTFLEEQHSASVTGYHVLTTTSTKPKKHGGPVVLSISELKRYEQCGAGFATPMSDASNHLMQTLVMENATAKRWSQDYTSINHP